MGSGRDTAEAVTAVVDAYFGAWQRNEPDVLPELFAPDIRVEAPLGPLEGAARYQDSLIRLFDLAGELVFHKRWIDGNDVLTWFDLYPRGIAEPLPVASWLHIAFGRITHVKVTFDLGRLLQAADPRRASNGTEPTRQPGPSV
ncbi:nuclear transport factor 2 family protein [Streptomyces mirabilis]|uniref:nuclear transport factor 2 family protein n=1 Tax=Streptomyces mirabilis TaxID=68239 RepID=UPI003681D4D2